MYHHIIVCTSVEEFLDFDDYSSALIMEMEQLAQLEPHPNIVGLVRVCSVTSELIATAPLCNDNHCCDFSCATRTCLNGDRVHVSWRFIRIPSNH